MDVVLVTAGDPGRLTGGYLYNRHVLEALTRARIPVAALVLTESHVGRADQELIAALQETRPRLIILDSIALVPGARVARPPDVRLLALMHMLPSALVPPSDRPALGVAEAKVLPTADAIVTASRDLARRLEERGIRGRIEVIPPGRDQLPWGGPKPERHPGDPVEFLCVANWWPAKGIHLLVEAFSRVQTPAFLDLVGVEGAAAYAHRVRTAIDHYGVKDRVRVHGTRSGQDLAHRYGEADVFVLPSLEEGYGTVVSEALNAGLPVVAFALGPLQDLVTPECGVLAPPGDVDALAAAMERFARDIDWRIRAGQAAKRRAEDLPTWRETEERFVQVVRELLNPPGSA